MRLIVEKYLFTLYCYQPRMSIQFPNVRCNKLCSLYFSYHTGSLAFGALIIAIIQFIRFVLSHIQRQLKKRKEARWAQIMLTIFQCCFWCLEKILRYVNRQAYIEVTDV